MKSISPSIADQLKALGLRSSVDPVDGYKYYTVIVEISKPMEDEEAKKAALPWCEGAAELLLLWTKEEYIAGPPSLMGSAFYYLRMLPPHRSVESMATWLNTELRVVAATAMVPPPLVQAITDFGIKISVLESQPHRRMPNGKTLIEMFD